MVLTFPPRFLTLHLNCEAPVLQITVLGAAGLHTPHRQWRASRGFRLPL